MVHAHNRPLDVLMSGTVFFDIVMTGLPQPPQPGVEIWTEGMGSSPGGIANLAVAAARLDLHTGLAACFSDDGYGQWCWEILSAQEQVDLSLSRVCSCWHSPVTVSLAYNDDRAMVTHGHPSPIPAAELIGTPPPPRAILADLEEEPWWRKVADNTTKVFLDTGWDPTGAWNRAALDNLDGAYCFTPNLGEAMAYTRTDTPEHALRALADLVPMPVVTLGSQGAITLDTDSGRVIQVPALPVSAIDPTGAGDVFGAALACASLAEWEVEHRLLFAALCSSLAVQHFGGSLAAPGWGDIADWHNAVTTRAHHDPAAAEIATRYGFLSEVLPSRTRRSVRRADATVARFSDLHPAAETSFQGEPARGRLDKE